MKLHAVHIQNYKSLRDVTIRLQNVNLFIGPNNSGKSNALNALRFFMGNFLYSNSGVGFSNIFKKDKSNEVSCYFILKQDEENYIHIKFNQISTNRFWKIGTRGEFNHEFKDIIDGFEWTDANEIYIKPLDEIKNFFENITIYNINPSSFSKPKIYESASRINSDASNLMSFLVNLRDSDRKIYKQIEADLYKCVKQFNEIALPNMNKEGTERTIKFFEPDGTTSFFAEEVSEGVLYFLALLCIVHQPNPPKLLLLEEPEKGIHPRRIKEIMDYIFDLAKSKDIQIIMTTHSTQVVDEFKDIPENIFVFDKENDETIVRNLQNDVIDVYNERSAKKHLPPINLSGSLGDHWASGLLGGVPL